MKTNPQVDGFLKNAKLWKEEMTELRSILLKTKLDEDFKWRLPCYAHGEKNIVIIQPFKACLGLMFFKGALLKDSKKVLVQNGPNSNAPRRLEFKSKQDVKKLASTIKSYINEAIKIEESGQKVETKKTATPIPVELKKAFTQNSKLKKAFAELTPGRQRAYLIHFSSAQQSATKTARIEKCIPQIIAGKGFNER
jgi:uncharacterized protein YdeI (YjbR/CyaY-like superfamily)